jgi:putative salt-induced outer membrane protein YdiY
MRTPPSPVPSVPLPIASDHRAPAIFLLVGCLLVLAPGARAQEEPDPEPGAQWRNTSELSFLVNQGNAVQRSLGFRHALRRTSRTGELRADLATLRTDATRVQRTAVGTEGDFRVEEERDTERTAERWSAQLRYDRNLSEVLFASGSVRWERNTFAGFRARTVASLGAGTRWGSPDRWEVKLGSGLTYTLQDDVAPDPDGLRRFAGIRVTLDYEHQLASSTKLEVAWLADGNAQEWGDVRGDLTQSVATALSDRLALKTTFQVLLDNDPPLQRIPLLAPNGEETGATVLTPLRKRDQVIAVALVLTL